MNYDFLPTLLQTTSLDRLPRSVGGRCDPSNVTEDQVLDFVVCGQVAALPAASSFEEKDGGDERYNDDDSFDGGGGDVGVYDRGFAMSEGGRGYDIREAGVDSPGGGVVVSANSSSSSSRSRGEKGSSDQRGRINSSGGVGGFVGGGGHNNIHSIFHRHTHNHNRSFYGSGLLPEHASKSDNAEGEKERGGGGGRKKRDGGGGQHWNPLWNMFEKRQPPHNGSRGGLRQLSSPPFSMHGGEGRESGCAPIRNDGISDAEQIRRQQQQSRRHRQTAAGEPLNRPYASPGPRGVRRSTTAGVSRRRGAQGGNSGGPSPVREGGDEHIKDFDGRFMEQALELSMNRQVR